MLLFEQTTSAKLRGSKFKAKGDIFFMGQAQERCVFDRLTCYIKLSVEYFELKLHIHTLGTSEIYFTSCKKGIIPPL